MSRWRQYSLSRQSPVFVNLQKSHRITGQHGHVRNGPAATPISCCTIIYQKRFLIPFGCLLSRTGRYHQRTPIPCTCHNWGECSTGGVQRITSDPASWTTTPHVPRYLFTCQQNPKDVKMQGSCKRSSPRSETGSCVSDSASRSNRGIL